MNNDAQLVAFSLGQRLALSKWVNKGWMTSRIWSIVIRLNKSRKTWSDKPRGDSSSIDSFEALPWMLSWLKLNNKAGMIKSAYFLINSSRCFCSSDLRKTPWRPRMPQHRICSVSSLDFALCWHKPQKILIKCEKSWSWTVPLSSFSLLKIVNQKIN